MLIQTQILADRYLLTDCLADKTGRQTWKAIDRQTNQTVVLKVLLFGTGIQWQDVKLFEREAQLLRSLNLPQVPRYLDDFELDLPDARGFVLVQSYLDARSLEFYLESGYTFTEAEVKEIAEQLLRLLIQLHDRTVPIIHRDIKPSNILLSDRSAHSVGKIYLVDFGAAMAYGLSGKGTVTIVGTFGYIPPEQFAGQTVLASDLYSLGITLIALLKGVSADSLSETPGRMALESLTEIEPGMVDWLRKMTEPTLERRFRSVKQALEALQQSSQQQNSLASPEVDTCYRKPSYSRIVIKKSINTVTVQFPGTGAAYDDGVSTVIFSLPVLTIFLVICIIPMNWVIMPFFFLLFIPVNSVVSLILAGLIYSFLCNGRLEITSTQIHLTRYVLGICVSRQSSWHNSIFKLERVNAHTKYADGRFYSAERSHLLLWAGTQAYELHFMSPAEVNWLSQELSSLLEILIEDRTGADR